MHFIALAMKCPKKNANAMHFIANGCNEVPKSGGNFVHLVVSLEE